MRNKSSQLQQENAKTSMQHTVASVLPPHDVKERMQSGFLHPVRFPTSQCRVKVCSECVCLRYRFTKSVFTFTKLCGVSIVPQKRISTESSHGHPTNTSHKENILCELIHHLHVVLISITHAPIRSVYRSNSSAIQSLNETILHI